jgi:hypothetical protein
MVVGVLVSTTRSGKSLMIAEAAESDKQRLQTLSFFPFF